MIDKMMNMTAGFMEKASKWIKFPSLPWDSFRTNWLALMEMIKDWNQIVPITDALTILGLVLSVFAAMILFYIVVLVKSFIPFSGGK
jgi:hypothetical protein